MTEPKQKADKVYSAYVLTKYTEATIRTMQKQTTWKDSVPESSVLTKPTSVSALRTRRIFTH